MDHTVHHTDLEKNPGGTVSRSENMSRRRMLEIALQASGLALVGGVGSLLAQGVQRDPTPELTKGPFYPVLKPLDKDADLTVIAGRTGRAQGKVVHMTGRVLKPNGEPVRGAKVEIWQANTHGRYAHPSDSNPAPLDPNFQGFGIQTTDNEGRYHFKTIKPGAYPSSPDRMRPPHIHVDVFGKRDHLVTQMFFPGEPLNDRDRIFLSLGAEKSAALAQLKPPTKDMESDEILLVYDIVLARG
jgi:protocatechuate 3,4-dioxygenase beta subunit